MTNPNKSHIALVLDRSGSMASIMYDTIGSVNKFIEEQKAEPGECTFTLAQFDNLYEVVHENVDIQEVPVLTARTFIPRGMTALLDAIGRTIKSTGEYLARLPEKDRPGKVIFVIMTDGYENASREYSRPTIHEMIRHQRENYAWEFIFLGANQDAITVAQSYGIGGQSAITYAPTSQGTANSVAATSKAVSSARRGEWRGFTSSDRKNATK